MIFKSYTDASVYNNGYAVSKELPQVTTGAFIVLNEEETNIIKQTRYNFKDNTISYGELKTYMYTLDYALSSLKKGDILEIHSDSQFVVKGVTEWMSGWKKRGWKNSSGTLS